MRLERKLVSTYYAWTKNSAWLCKAAKTMEKSISYMTVLFAKGELYWLDQWPE